MKAPGAQSYQGNTDMILQTNLIWSPKISSERKVVLEKNWVRWACPRTSVLPMNDRLNPYA